MRKTCLDMVYELAKTDDRIFFIGSDLGVGTLKQFKQEMPERYFMEGDQVRFTNRGTMKPLASPDQPHTMRHIRLLWESTEAYRAMYYNSPEERRRSIDAHDQIMAAMHDGDADRLIAELDCHRERALTVLCGILERDDDA